MATTAKDIMSPSVATCTAGLSIKQAARLMLEEDCGALPVVDEGSGTKPIGIITDRDIACRAVANGLNPEIATVGSCMSRPAICVHYDASILECARLLSQNQIRRLVVVDRDGICCGVVAQADVARATPPETAGNVVKKVSEPQHEHDHEHVAVH